MRHKLQKGLLTRDQQPKEEEMKQMSEFISKLEGYADLVEAKMIDDTRALAAGLRKLLEGQGDLGQIRDAYQKLEAMTFAIAEKMYGGQSGT